MPSDCGAFFSILPNFVLSLRPILVIGGRPQALPMQGNPVKGRGCTCSCDPHFKVRLQNATGPGAVPSAGRNATKAWEGEPDRGKPEDLPKRQQLFARSGKSGSENEIAYDLAYRPGAQPGFSACGTDAAAGHDPGDRRHGHRHEPSAQGRARADGGHHPPDAAELRRSLAGRHPGRPDGGFRLQ